MEANQIIVFTGAGAQVTVFFLEEDDARQAFEMRVAGEQLELHDGGNDAQRLLWDLRAQGLAQVAIGQLFDPGRGVDHTQGCRHQKRSSWSR
jgi:hypothetical protein